MKFYSKLQKLTCSLGVFLLCMVSAQAADQSHVILIITDDQGYGDIATHGSPVLKTSDLDKLHSESL